MGAELWQQLAPWRSDPEEALHELQRSFISEKYDLLQFVRDRLESARSTVAYTEASGDEYGLLEIYRADLDLLERAAESLPQSPVEQIQLLRDIEASGGQGVGNVLDIKGVSDVGGAFYARRWHHDEVYDSMNTYAPTLEDAQAAVGGINAGLDRGECVCFIVYADDRKTPLGWYFVGNTID